MIIDAHTRAFPDPIAERAVESLAGTVDPLLASMDAAAIDRSGVTSVATNPAQSMPILEWSKLSRSPRLEPLGSVHACAQTGVSNRSLCEVR